jgi:predicted O-methyltransferase YrrM
MLISEYLAQKGFNNFEGSCQQVPEQIQDLIKLTQQPNINVMEIGFNAGHSAEVFLSNNLSLNLTSFDLGLHSYVNVAKEFIDTTYPGRHTLILGDSRSTVRDFVINNSTNKKFDIIFIDGGHDYTIAKADLKNCLQLSHENTIIIMDDTYYTDNKLFEWTYGPTRTWKEYIADGKIQEMGRKDYCEGRGMSWGIPRYN